MSVQVGPGIEITIRVTSDTDGMATRAYVDEKIQEAERGEIKTVNGAAPDENGNVQVSGLPEGEKPHQQLVTDAEGKAVWEERTHYKGSPTLTTLIPETTMTGTEMGGAYVLGEPWPVNLNENVKYLVSWDGVEYECDVKNYEGLLYLGNYLAVAEPSTEPFCFLQDGEDTLLAIAMSSGSHNFSLTGIVQEVALLDMSYLPIDQIVEAVKKQMTLITEVRFESVNNGNDLIADKTFEEVNRAALNGIVIGRLSGRMYVGTRTYGTTGYWEVCFYRYTRELYSNGGADVIAVIAMLEDGTIEERAFKLTSV